MVFVVVGNLEVKWKLRWKVLVGLGNVEVKWKNRWKIQEKIINEIETLEVFEKDSKEKVENYNQNMEDIINSVVGESIKLKYIN